MREDLQKQKKAGLINLGDEIPTHGSNNKEREKITFSENETNAFFRSMSNPQFLQELKITPDPNAYYTM